MDKSVLLGRKASTTRTVTINGAGVIIVRGLTRGEVQAINDEYGDDPNHENALIAAAMVDPEMTVEEVACWLEDAPAGDSVEVMTAVAELSGISEGSARKSVSRSGRRGQRRRV